MIKPLSRLIRHPGGSSAAEFAMVLPLLLIFLFGIIDVGRLMWTWNKAEKATQMGVRYAVVTDVIPSELNDDFVDEYGIPGGNVVTTATFSSTTCDTSNCSGGWGYNGTAFDSLVDRMQQMMPEITDTNVTIEYENVGLGYSGDPSGPDVSALVTVRLQNMTFRPLLLFGGSIGLPDFRAALTLEDAAGTASN